MGTLCEEPHLLTLFIFSPHFLLPDTIGLVIIFLAN